MIRKDSNQPFDRLTLQSTNELRSSHTSFGSVMITSFTEMVPSGLRVLMTFFSRFTTAFFFPSLPPAPAAPAAASPGVVGDMTAAAAAAPCMMGRELQVYQKF